MISVLAYALQPFVGVDLALPAAWALTIATLAGAGYLMAAIF